jgi:hypothetical protein
VSCVDNSLLTPITITSQAIATYQVGLGHDPENAELKEGIEGCLSAIGRFASGE